MKELLKQWARLEPDTVEIDGNYLNISGGSLFESWETECLDIDGLVGPVVQATVQQAIEARGWDWKLHAADYKRGSRRVYYGTTQWWVRVTNRMDSKMRSAHDAASALLDSYLSAIEATGPGK